MPDPTGFEYDVFISYSSRDKDWVRGELLRRVEEVGLLAFIDFRDFKRGAASIKEMERGITNCRKTLIVLTPAYVESEWCEIETVMLQTLSPANRDLRLIPLLKTSCDKPLRIGALTHIDFTDSADFDLVAATSFFIWKRRRNVPMKRQSPPTFRQNSTARRALWRATRMLRRFRFLNVPLPLRTARIIRLRG
jgi:hypothetical protein